MTLSSFGLKIVSEMVFLKLFVILISIHSFSSHPHIGILGDQGILVIGGLTTSASVEFWSPADPEQGSCELSDYPREISQGPTANLVSGQLVVCYGDSCEDYDNGTWSHLAQTMHPREGHSSAVLNDEKILLIGGQDSRSTEWIPVDGSPAQPGPFDVRHGARHCSVQIDSDVIIVTGGFNTEDYVTKYQLTDGTETPLTPMTQARQQHACGVYQGADLELVKRNCCSFTLISSFRCFWSLGATTLTGCPALRF